MSKLCSACGINWCGCGGGSVCSKCKQSKTTSPSTQQYNTKIKNISSENAITSTISYEIMEGKIKFVSTRYSFTWQIEDFNISGKQDTYKDVSMLPKGDYTAIITIGSKSEKMTIKI